MDSVEISKSEYDELKLYKKLVENNLSEELSEEELKLVINADKGETMSEEEFLNLNKNLKNV